MRERLDHYDAPPAGISNFSFDRAEKLERALDVIGRMDAVREKAKEKTLEVVWDNGEEVQHVTLTPEFKHGVQKVAAGLFHDLKMEGEIELARYLVKDRPVKGGFR